MAITFSDLSEGDAFIPLPISDNPHILLRKIVKIPESTRNSVNLATGHLIQMNEFAEVVRVDI